MRIVMFQKDKEILFEFVKNDEIAVSIVEKFFLLEEGTLYKRIKNLIARKSDDVSSAEISYLNDILSDIKHYEEYPVIKRIKSHVYYLKNNELMKVEFEKTDSSEPSKVVCYYIYQIGEGIFVPKRNGFLRLLYQHCMSREVQ